MEKEKKQLVMHLLGSWICKTKFSIHNLKDCQGWRIYENHLGMFISKSLAFPASHGSCWGEGWPTRQGSLVVTVCWESLEAGAFHSWNVGNNLWGKQRLEPLCTSLLCSEFPGR